ncbi:unnamed protein product [Ectocarpus sp. 4 AP-2014]
MNESRNQAPAQRAVTKQPINSQHRRSQHDPTLEMPDVRSTTEPTRPAHQPSTKHADDFIYSSWKKQGTGKAESYQPIKSRLRVSPLRLIMHNGYMIRGKKSSKEETS